MRKVKSIKTKILIRIVLSFILLSIIMQGIVFLSFRSFSLESTKEKALTVAELIRDTITSFMILGVYDRRDIFIDRIKSAHGLKDVNILRGATVINQFGGQKNINHIKTSLEAEVLQTGKINASLNEDLARVEYSLVIPYKATANESVKCLNCHSAKDGDVLGAVSLVMDLSAQRQKGISSVSYMLIVSLVFSIGTLYMIYVFFKPYTSLFQKLNHGFQKVEDGDFSEKIIVNLIDEAGDVAGGFNAMTDNLSKTLSAVSNKVSLLIGHRMEESGNALKDTARTVDMLVKIYKYKRTIEKDSRKNEVFMRLEQTIEEMGIDKYSIYEVDSQKNTIQSISVSCPNEGTLKSMEREQVNTDSEVCWCNMAIKSNADECRAKRTGNFVDSRDFPLICPSFAYTRESLTGQLNYFCIPIFIGGQVGDVVQIIYDRAESDSVRDAIPYVKSFIQESDSVIEAKTFMELLRKQSLVDALTGLYNRRFLDEIYLKICSQTLRRNTVLGILMIDIDFFKQVNDTYGHDVGDKVLEKISSIIKNSVRDADIVVRYGGEEIIALLVDVTEGRSLDVAEKMRQRIQEETIEFPGGVLKKTISIGVSEYPNNADKFWQCVKYADTVLYKAKEDGRNRVYVFNRDMWDKVEY
ncbi:MAG: diguanylate cyclase [Nitrospirae bacterium]|nr:diguanylate cyclase [Nitrospirota bacterium]